VTASNEAAVAFIDRWPDWPAPALVIHGPSGCGKTHLAEVFRARTGALFVAPTSLSDDRVGEIVRKDVCVVLDGAGPGQPERPLLHLYNALREAEGYLLVTATVPPARWGLALPDLRSRLNAAPTVSVGPPDDALMAALFIKLFADRQLSVGDDVLAYIIPRVERSFAAAGAVVAALDEAAMTGQRRITVPLARAIVNRSVTMNQNKGRQQQWTLE